MDPFRNAPSDVQFLDMQAAVGVSKHIGGFAAMDELLSLCHIEDAREVLDAGCGIGVGPAYLARKFTCRVVGTDISEKMIEWSRQRAREEGIEDRVEFHAADVQKLPFEDGRFDVVICQSVLAFVADKQRAIREFVRVTKPGGYIGLNEAFWVKQPPPDMLGQIRYAIGPDLLTLEAWQSLWELSGLEERTIKTRQINARTEVKSRFAWIGWRWLLRAWGRAIRLSLRDPSVRQAIRKSLAVAPATFEYFGYGLFVGRKQAPGAAGRPIR
jgi:ubiquinone/menaquinone biosynthesis C-methylase UbiE